MTQFITKFLVHIANVKIETNIVCKPLFKNKTYIIKIYKKRHMKHQYSSILNHECENDSQGGHEKKKSKKYMSKDIMCNILVVG
jgi:hypothetical protein